MGKSKTAKSEPRDYDAQDRREAKDHPDYKLIKACVEFGFVAGGVSPGFNIDPTDSLFAGTFDSECCARVEEILTRAAKMPAITLDGLAAKGAVTQQFIDAMDHNFIHDFEIEFVRSLAADATRFHAQVGGKHVASTTNRPFPSTQEAKMAAGKEAAQ